MLSFREHATENTLFDTGLNKVKFMRIVSLNYLAAEIIISIKPFSDLSSALSLNGLNN